MKLSLNSTASTLEPGGRRDRVAYPAALSASVAMTPAWTNPSCWLSSGRLLVEISTKPFSRREIRAWSSLMNPCFRKLILTCCKRFIPSGPSQLLPYLTILEFEAIICSMSDSEGCLDLKRWRIRPRERRVVERSLQPVQNVELSHVA